MADDALEYLRRLFRRAATGRADLDAGLVLPAVVDDLQIVLACLVNRQRGAVVDSPRLADVVRPLKPVVRVRIGELVIIFPSRAGAGFPILTALEPLLGFVDDIFRLHQFIHALASAGAFRFNFGFITCFGARVRPGNSSVSTHIHASARLGERSPV